MKTYLKTLVRTFKKHITRLVSIIFIVLVAVGFSSGIGLAADTIGYSLSDYYKSSNVCDFIVKSTTGNGFSEADVAAVKDICAGAQVQTLSAVDAKIGVAGEERLMRLYFMDFDNWSINTVREGGFLSGKMPADESFALSENGDKRIKEIPAGEKITLDFAKILESSASLNGRELPALYKSMLAGLDKPEVEISGVVNSPLSFGTDGEPAAIEENDGKGTPDTTNAINELVSVDGILYISDALVPSIFNVRVLGTTDIWVAMEDRELFSDFGSAYKNQTEEQKLNILSHFTVDGEETARVLTLYDNYSFYALHSYGEKVELIGYVLMAAFLCVTALVTLSTMTRLLEEERSEIACLKTLGYSSFKIIFKYLLFAAIATGIGGVGAYFVGVGLSSLLYWVFGYSFDMPPMSPHIAVAFFLITFAVIVIITLVATFAAGLKLTSATPASLLRPKAPKPGKKVIIEKIPALWNRLSFKYKSTVRNVLRFKSRFVMTVVAVGISMGLVMAGLTLLDICLFRGAYSVSILLVALVVIFFAGLLTAVVIYTLTNINISERNRELATLKVLGYFDGEVAGYIYREIYIDAAIGIIVGYPLSALIMYFLFSIMNAGTYATFMWAVAPFVVFGFTAIVTLLLRRRIVKIDMNESLKANE